MSAVVDFLYDESVIDNIKKWHYGTNWPVVYIFYNNNKAYIGETIDAVRRTEQHRKESEFRIFTNLCLISNKTFNKSVILDLESYLIKYMSADASKELINGNAGVAEHNYFYKEAYEDDFKEIWKDLKERGIVNQSIIDIENSELYKYSPYKSLNKEQLKAAYDILNSLYDINNASAQSIIEVNGGAGTGKTILAVYLVKLLVDINRKKKIWNSVDDYSDALFLSRLSEKLSGIKKIGFVVPMIELRKTMKKMFASIDGLSVDMVLAPEQTVNGYYDVLVVDEAHRLYQRKHLPGQQLYAKFDKINKQLMAESFTGTVNDYTELDWILKSSRIQILFYDGLQTIRATDIEKERFDLICRPHLYKYIELFSQMRCRGGNGYYEYVKKVLTCSGLTVKSYRKVENYQLKVVDSIQELFDLINKKNIENGLCRVISGPGWCKDEEILIEGHSYRWAGDNKSWTEPEKTKDTIFSVHKIQGFDLNYAGVIFGKEVYYDLEAKCIAVRKKELKDNFTKSSGDVAMRQYILNIYLTLMTRGIDGTYVYVVDENLREYLKVFLN